MGEFVQSMRLTAEAQGFNQTLGEASGAIDKTGEAAARAKGQVQGLTQALNEVEAKTTSAGKGAEALGEALGGAAEKAKDAAGAIADGGKSADVVVGPWNRAAGAADAAGKSVKAAGAEISVMGGVARAGAGLIGEFATALIGGAGLAVATWAVTTAIDAFKKNLADQAAGEKLAMEMAADLGSKLQKARQDTIDLAQAAGLSAQKAREAADSYTAQALAANQAAEAIRNLSGAQAAQRLDKVNDELGQLKTARSGFNPFTTNQEEALKNSQDAVIRAVYGRSYLAPSGDPSQVIAGLTPEQRARARPQLLAYNKAALAVSDNAQATEALQNQKQLLEDRILGTLAPVDTSTTTVDELVVTAKPKRTRAGPVNRAGNLSTDLTADVAALREQREALKAGGQALDEWTIKEAGRQAVEKAGLTHKASLTAAETTLAGKIRSTAEETERLKLANDRVGEAIGLKKSADEDREALERRAAAAMKGEQALEDLQVQEAGLEALRKIGIETLDQLTGADRAEAEAAIASAQARERQAIATERASRVGDTLRDLDRSIEQEKARAVAIAGTTAAEVAYAREEFERQVIQKAGNNLTIEEIALLKAKADILFATQAANDEGAFQKGEAERLRYAQMTNRERAVEERYTRISTDLRTRNLDLTEDELDARARAAALAEQGAADDAEAIGRLKEDLRQTFIETGHLSFDNVADYAKQRLRAAIYDALLAKPFDIIINAVVGGLSGLGGAANGVASLASGGGIGGLASAGAGIGGMFAAGGALQGVASSALSLIPGMGSFMATGTAAAAGLGGGGLMAGLGASLASNPIGWIVGAGLLGATLLKGKPSNHGALATFDDNGFSISGDKANDQTSGWANQVGQSIVQAMAALKAGGLTPGVTVSQVDIGQRDKTDIVLSDGRTINTAKGDPGAASAAALKAMLEGAKDLTDAERAVAASTLEFDEALQKIVSGRTFGTNLDKAFMELLNPAAFERQKALDAVEDTYEALKAEAQDLVSAGLIASDQLAKLDMLHSLQVDDALARLGAAADQAATSIGGNFAQGLADQLLQLTDPNGYAQQQIQNEMDARRRQAATLIAAGEVGSEIYDVIDQLQAAKIAQSLGSFSSSVDSAADAARQMSDSLTDWLAKMRLSPSAELSPAERRRVAMEQYQAALAAGDKERLTGYADTLLSADRDATSSAQARLALYQQVMNQVEGLAGVAQTQWGSSAAIVGVNSPSGLTELLNAQTAAMQAANDQNAQDIAAQVQASQAQTLKVIGEIQATGVTPEAMAALVDAITAQAGATADMGREFTLLAAYLRQRAG